MLLVVWCLRCARARLRSLFSPLETRRDHSASLGAIIANHNCISLQNPYKTRVSFAEFAACKPIISLDPYKNSPGIGAVPLARIMDLMVQGVPFILFWILV